MAILTEEEIRTNATGILSVAQLKRIRRKGYGQLVAAISFLILVPASVLMADMRLGVLLIIWLVFGLLFAGIFLHSAITYLRIKPSTPVNINSVSGKIIVKPSGKRNVIITINERTFFMMVNEASSLKDGKSYTLFYLDKPKVVIGWTEIESAVENESVKL